MTYKWKIKAEIVNFANNYSPLVCCYVNNKFKEKKLKHLQNNPEHALSEYISN